MNRVLITLMVLLLGNCVFCEEVPTQDIANSKTYFSTNYNRQDTEQVGVQKIVNDHSFFNINIQIYKKGKLFQKNDTIKE